MTRFVLILLLFAMITFVPLSVAQIGMAEAGFGMPLLSSPAVMGKTGHVANGGSHWFWDWLRTTFQKIFSEIKEHRETSKGSVPIPETFLLFGVGFAGLVAWQIKQPRD
jgi:hypothetical protein